MLKLGEDRHELQDTGVLQCGAVWRRSYRTVRLGVPAKFIILHSKIGRRVDFARVRYGTMQSESMRSLGRLTLICCSGRTRAFIEEGFVL